MAIYRQVHTSFWQDTKVMDEMTPEDKYFFLYLLTNPATNQLGCYEISKRQMSNETGYNLETIEKLIKRFEDILKVIRYSNDTKELLILNWAKYNWTSSPKVKVCVQKELQTLKNKEFVKFLDRVCIGYAKSMHTHTQEEQEEEQEEEQNKNKGEKKSKYAPNIRLTKTEYKNLCIEFTEERTKQAIKYLSDYKIETGKTYKCDNLTLRRWVFDALSKKEIKSQPTGRFNCDDKYRV